MKRREVLATAGSGALIGTAAGVVAPVSAAPGAPKLPAPASGIRINLQQASKVMASLNVDALLLGQGENFRYATGFQPVVSRMGYPAGNLALVVGGENPRVAALMMTFSYYFLASDISLNESVPVSLYGPQDEEALRTGFSFPNRGAHPLRALEAHRQQHTAAVAKQHAVAPTLSQGLTDLLRRYDLEKAAIAVDDGSILKQLQETRPGGAVTMADDALRRIRPVKSAAEIALMRTASAINIQATHACLNGAGAGTSFRELRAAFYAEAARRGGKGVFMVIDGSSDEQFEKSLEPGQSFLIDCVSEYEGYHGDYGRTVMLGEPTPAVDKATRAISRAWQQLRGELKPGLSFSKIRELGQTAMAQHDGRLKVPFNPHSVGMLHTDHVGDGTSPPREDIILEPGMIISVDCPLLESGLGGSVHLEDLMLITQDGAEPIHELGNDTITPDDVAKFG